MNVLMQFPTVISNSHKLTPWVEIVLKEDNTINTDDLKKSSRKLFV